MRKIKLSISLALSLLLGASLFSVSGPSCGCEEPWMDFLAEFGLKDDWRNFDNLDGLILTNASNKYLIGKKINNLNLPEEVQPKSCKVNNESEFNCEFWFIKGALRQKGFHVIIKTDKDKKINNVQVENIHLLFNTWRFD